MIVSQADDPIAEAKLLRQENEALKERLAELSRASIGVSDHLESDDALQQIVRNAKNLTGARYGVLMTFDASGALRDLYTEGISADEREQAMRPDQESALFERLKNTDRPVRLKGAAAHSHLARLPGSLSDAQTLMGVPIHCSRDHVASMYLVDKEGGQEFSDEDEAIAAVLGAQAASIVSYSRSNDESRQTTTDMEALMENCPVGVSLFDARLGAITYLNQESRRMIGALGLATEELGSVFFSLKFTRPDGREYAFEDFPGTRALQSGETVTAEEIVVHRLDGTTLTVLVHCVPIFSGSGEIVSVLTISQDLTPLQQQELRRAEFLQMVSSELRTPVISIQGAAAALRNIEEPTLRTEQRQLMRIIDQQADLMRSQINSLVELTQIETGTLRVAAEPTSVSGLIEWACGEYLSEYGEITIQTDIPDGLDPVLADRERIGKVLHNFFRQAAKHSGESSPVVVSAAVDGIHVAISVHAEGGAAPPDLVSLPVNSDDDPLLFDGVSQGHARAVELASQGEGLAMAFCRGVVEAHGGRMGMDVDEDGNSLVLTFTLPSVEDAPQPRVPFFHAQDTDGEPLPTQGQQTTILVSIEDAELLRAVRQILLDAGYETVATPHLHEIEELASLERPGLVLLDIAGRQEESFHSLDSTWNTLNLPAIVLCDRSDEDYVVRAYDMGSDGYVVKPFSPSELVARVRASLRKSNAVPSVAAGRAYEFGDVLINLDDRIVSKSGQPVRLTATEYKLLTELCNSAGTVLSQGALLGRVWGPEYSGESQILRSFIKSLRQKLGDNAREPRYIFTEHGVGYRMARPDPAG